MPLDEDPSAPREARSDPLAGPLEADVARLREMRAIIDRMTPQGREAVAGLLREKGTEAPRTGRRGTFGMFAGQFSVGPEFFEPLSDEELRAWGEI